MCHSQAFRAILGCFKYEEVKLERRKGGAGARPLLLEPHFLYPTIQPPFDMNRRAHGQSSLAGKKKHRLWAQPDLGSSHGSAHSSCVTWASDFVIPSLRFLICTMAITVLLGDTGPGGGRVHSRPSASENYCELLLCLVQSHMKLRRQPGVSSFIPGRC